MRSRLILGAAMLIIGGIGLARGLHYTSKHDIADLGGIRVSTDEQKSIEPWIGGVIAVVGLVLILSSGKKA